MSYVWSYVWSYEWSYEWSWWKRGEKEDRKKREEDEARLSQATKSSESSASL